MKILSDFVVHSIRMRHPSVSPLSFQGKKERAKDQRKRKRAKQRKISGKLRMNASLYNKFSERDHLALRGLTRDSAADDDGNCYMHMYA
jgi:hypothetical protein